VTRAGVGRTLLGAEVGVNARGLPAIIARPLRTVDSHGSPVMSA
jgi:hypothetical protein